MGPLHYFYTINPDPLFFQKNYCVLDFWLVFQIIKMNIGDLYADICIHVLTFYVRIPINKNPTRTQAKTRVQMSVRLRQNNMKIEFIIPNIQKYKKSYKIEIYNLLSIKKQASTSKESVRRLPRTSTS